MVELINNDMQNVVVDVTLQRKQQKNVTRWLGIMAIAIMIMMAMNVEKIEMESRKILTLAYTCSDDSLKAI